MTRNEVLAYNAGIVAVLGLAARSAAAIEPLIITKPTRHNFAHGALLALAEEGQALLKDLPDQDPAEGEPALVTPKLTASAVTLVAGRTTT